MTKNQSDFWRKAEFTQHHRFNSLTESPLLLQSEYFHKSTNKKNRNTNSETEIIFALGFIITIIAVSGVQLYRSLKVTPEISNLELKRNSIVISDEELELLSGWEKIDFSTQKIESIAIKNAIANGKF